MTDRREASSDGTAAPEPPAPVPIQQGLLGEFLGERGMTMADSAVDREWRDRADAAVLQWAASGEEFTAEEIRAAAGDPDHHNAFGSVFRRARLRGLIRRVDWRNASRATRHSNQLRVWVGTEKAKRLAEETA